MLLNEYIPNHLLKEIPGPVLVYTQAYLSRVIGCIDDKRAAVGYLKDMMELDCYKNMTALARGLLSNAFDMAMNDIVTAKSEQIMPRRRGAHLEV